jgi:hypothetical protein
MEHGVAEGGEPLQRGVFDDGLGELGDGYNKLMPPRRTAPRVTADPDSEYYVKEASARYAVLEDRDEYKPGAAACDVAHFTSHNDGSEFALCTDTAARLRRQGWLPSDGYPSDSVYFPEVQ